MPQQTTIFRIEIDPNLIPDAEVGPLLDALSDFAPVLESFGRLMTGAEKSNFATQGGTFGLDWAALSPSTLREKERQGFPSTPLVRTGALQASIGEAISLTPDSVQVGVNLSDVPYAAYHQAGTVRMPARVLVAVTEDMVDEMLQTLRSYLANATGGDLTGITIVAEGN